MTTQSGNLDQVRQALHGITGVEARPVCAGPDRYLVMARMNHELDTVDSFRRQGLRAYWPSYETRVASQRRVGGCLTQKMKRVGILPGYVFCEVDPYRDLTIMLDSTVGAFDVVRHLDHSPLLIADADIQIIRRIEIGLNAPAPIAASYDFKTGEKVRFTDDLVGRWPPGRIVKLAREGRISVEVDLMGRKVKITVLPHQIERM